MVLSEKLLYGCDAEQLFLIGIETGLCDCLSDSRLICVLADGPALDELEA